MANIQVGSVFGWVKRKGYCSYEKCGDRLELGQQQVKTRFMQDGKFIGNRREHMECWIERMEQWFRDNPYKPKKSGNKGGRAALTSNPEDKRERATLLQKRNRLQKKIDYYSKLGLMSQVTELIQMVSDINTRLNELGGQDLYGRDVGGLRL